MVRACLFALLLGAFCLRVPAQAPPPDGAAPPAEQMQGQGRHRREIARLYLIQRMRETLSLTDAQTLKAMEVLKAIDGERARHRQAMMDIMSRIQAHLEDGKTSDKVLARDVADFQAQQTSFEKRLRDLESRLLAGLTPRQQAEFLVMRQDLMQQMRGGGGPRRRFHGRRPSGRRGR